MCVRVRARARARACARAQCGLAALDVLIRSVYIGEHLQACRSAWLHTFEASGRRTSGDAAVGAELAEVAAVWIAASKRAWSLAKSWSVPGRGNRTSKASGSVISWNEQAFFSSRWVDWARLAWSA